MSTQRIISCLCLLICCSLLQGQILTESESVSITLNARYVEDVKKPVIQIIAPSVPDGTTYKTDNPRIELIGKVEDLKGVGSVIVNNQTSNIINTTKTDETGVFKIVFFLASGINKISLSAFYRENNQDSSIEKNIQMEYETPEASLANKIKNESLYYGLIIAINEYQDSTFSYLENPINQAGKLVDLLVTSYSFFPENITFIKNAERRDIIQALDELTKKITPKDNLLIFFSGHSYWIEASNVGFWLPADAIESSRGQWFSNSTLVDYIREIRAKHTLIIADACFSGSVFKPRPDIISRKQIMEDLYELPSRKAITSDTHTKDPDQSSFTRLLTEELSENKELLISSEQIFSRFIIAAANENGCIPTFGEIINVGDKDGAFVFIKK